MTEKAAEIQERNKELVKENSELQSRALIEKVAKENEQRDLQEEINRLHAVVVEKDQKIDHYKVEQDKALKAIEDFHVRFNDMKTRY